MPAVQKLFAVRTAVVVTTAFATLTTLSQSLERGHQSTVSTVATTSVTDAKDNNGWD
ncbi:MULTISPECIES: hypothetical protein [unclassified Streptomyces]|uniref:hypothetical protein n=1 Tax=unclassified Streptomyces TaxID=2593676 RepID=UPI0035DCFBF6